MTFEIDPRVCLRTGKDLAGSDHACCDYDHVFNQRPSGLSAELNERTSHYDYRAKMTEKSQSGYRGEDGLFTPEAYVMPPSPSDFLNARYALPAERAASPESSLYVPPGPNRRESFTQMLRRMFDRSAL